MNIVNLGFQAYLFWIGGFVIGWLILYYVIKTAVAHGIRDSGLFETLHERYAERMMRETKPNPAQLLLKEKYEKGGMTFEEYKSEWNRLKR